MSNGALVYFKIKTIAFATMYGEAGPLPIVVEHLQEFPKLTHNLDFFGKIKNNALQQFPISTPIFPYLGKSTQPCAPIGHPIRRWKAMERSK
jgi:hypothetical protein